MTSWTLLASVVAGGLLLFLGRRLFWVAVGALGGLLALSLVDLGPSALGTGPRLVVGAVAFVLGAALAFALQRVAVLVAGLLLGGFLGVELAPLLTAHPAYWRWGLVVAAALAGGWLAGFVFEAALVAVTAGAGALLVVRVLPLAPPTAAIAFLGLATVGIVVQSRSAADE